MHVLVATCAHRGNDARISARQIPALLHSGHQVTYLAPEPALPSQPGFHHILTRRAVGRRRVKAWIDIRRKALAVKADLLLIHDIELVPVLADHPALCRVWDVHEDFSAAIQDRAWIPSNAQSLLRWLVTKLELRADRHFEKILAEKSYREKHGDHVVVPNSTPVPEYFKDYDSSDPRVVYVGRISESRGLRTMLELGRRLAPDVCVELIGACDPDCEGPLLEAQKSGTVTWHGYLPNETALKRLEGALAGLSLLRDEPNFRHSLPTKMIEYMARGVPVIATRLPVAQEVANLAGTPVVDFDDVDAAESEVRKLLGDPLLRRELAHSGYKMVKRHYNWNIDRQIFVEHLENLVHRSTKAVSGGS